MIPCHDRETTLGSDVSVEDARLHVAAPLDLDEHTVVAGFGKNRREK